MARRYLPSLRITNSKISNDMKGLTGKFAGVEKIYEEANY